MASGNLGRLLLKYSWPALVAMCLNALYTVVDRFYIGHGCGEAAMAGLQLCMPVMMLMAAFGVFVGAGHATVLSIKLGENNLIACEKLVGQLVALKLLFFLILPPLILLNLDTILYWCGGNKVKAEALDAARVYLKIVIFSHIFSHLAFGLSALTRAEGGAVKSMTSLAVGFVANLVLDPLFIFGFDMGIKGAAWATVIAMMASFVWAIRYYLAGKTVVMFRWWRIRIYREFIWRTVSLGFAPFLQNLLSAMIVVSLTAAFAKWSINESFATQQIASLGVFNSVLILVIMPIMGAQQGLQPILGYNWGARNFKRVRDTLLLGFKVTTLLCIIACAVQVIPPFPRYLARLFVEAENTALIDLASHDLMISNCMLWMISINVVATTYFQSIGHPKMAVLLSTLRQGVILLPCIWILPHFIEDHAFAIWLSLPISDVLCQLATILPLWYQLRFLNGRTCARARASK